MSFFSWNDFYIVQFCNDKTKEETISFGSGAPWKMFQLWFLVTFSWKFNLWLTFFFVSTWNIIVASPLPPYGNVCIILTFIMFIVNVQTSGLAIKKIFMFSIWSFMWKQKKVIINCFKILYWWWRLYDEIYLLV